ncbi:MAG: hypothetical protein NVS9B8_07310 [Candidatus Limnocylindrales bacterium]
MTARLDGITAITFDFGNTLVPVGRTALQRVVERTADAIAERLPGIDRGTVLTAWNEERDRQFREEVPQLREVDLGERMIRVFARVRGMPPPRVEARWDQPRAAELADLADVAWAVDVYSRAFVAGMAATPGVAALLGRLAIDRDLAILSNWPLASTIDRFAEAEGWTVHLRAIIVSERVGTIKPHPAMFAAARQALGNPESSAILHVGDDWAADVVGANAAGWRTAWLRSRPDDTPLPSSEQDGSVVPDLELVSLGDLEACLAPPPGLDRDPRRGGVPAR